MSKSTQSELANKISQTVKVAAARLTAADARIAALESDNAALRQSGVKLASALVAIGAVDKAKESALADEIVGGGATKMAQALDLLVTQAAKPSLATVKSASHAFGEAVEPSAPAGGQVKQSDAAYFDRLTKRGQR